MEPLSADAPSTGADGRKRKARNRRKAQIPESKTFGNGRSSERRDQDLLGLSRVASDGGKANGG